MNKVIVYKKNNNTSILHPMPQMFDPNSRTRESLRQLGIDFTTDDEVLNYIINKDIPANTPYFIIDKDTLPADRYFRDAWAADIENEVLSIDVSSAIEVQKNVLRNKRKPLLEKLDVDFMKALEQGQDTTEISNKKQQLRDITNLEFPTTLTELKNFIPEILTEA